MVEADVTDEMATVANKAYWDCRGSPIASMRAALKAAFALIPQAAEPSEPSEPPQPRPNIAVLNAAVIQACEEAALHSRNAGTPNARAFRALADRFAAGVP